MPIEQVFMHANALDHDDIVSVPKSCPILISEFYDSILDKQQTPNNNADGLSGNDYECGRLKVNEPSEQREPTSPEHSPKQIKLLSLPTRRPLCDRGGKDLCRTIDIDKPPQNRAPLLPLSQGGEPV